MKQDVTPSLLEAMIIQALVSIPSSENPLNDKYILKKTPSTLIELVTIKLSKVKLFLLQIETYYFIFS